jgi:hypothetical protein
MSKKECETLKQVSKRLAEVEKKLKALLALVKK